MGESLYVRLYRPIALARNFSRACCRSLQGPWIDIALFQRVERSLSAVLYVLRFFCEKEQQISILVRRKACFCYTVRTTFLF